MGKAAVPGHARQDLQVAPDENFSQHLFPVLRAIFATHLPAFSSDQVPRDGLPIPTASDSGEERASDHADTPLELCLYRHGRRRDPSEHDRSLIQCRGREVCKRSAHVLLRVAHFWWVRCWRIRSSARTSGSQVASVRFRSPVTVSGWLSAAKKCLIGRVRIGSNSALISS